MAEEDILFGKNRHLFGGIEPSNMILFRSPIKNGVVCIVATPPNDTVIDGQTLCTVAGVVIRRKTDGYPLDEFDGDLVCDMSCDDMIQNYNKIYDEDADINVINYYAAFPYSAQGVYNRNPLNRCSTTEGEGYMYGFDLDTLDPEPSTRVTYPSDVDNTYFNSAYMDYNTSTFNYGDWNIEPGKDFMPRPCVLSNAGKVQYYLNPNDYTKKEDGSAANIDGTDGEVMMEWPKIYTYRELTEDGIYKFRCSNIKYDDNWECWCNYNHNDVLVPHFYTAVYAGCKYGSSDSRTAESACRNTYTGVNAVYATIRDTSSSFTPTSMRSTITKKGAGWNTEMLADRLLIQDLLIMMSATTDGQAVFGLGAKYKSTDLMLTGTMNDKGLFWGANDNDEGTGSKYGVKIFGMEHWWGYVARYTTGWVYDGSTSVNTQKIKITYGKRDGSTVEGYDSDYSGYISVGSIKTGYISDMKVFPFGRIPVSGSGSSSTYECDKLARANSSYVYNACVGGEINDSPGAGPFASSLAVHSTSNFAGNGYAMAMSYR